MLTGEAHIGGSGNRAGVLIGVALRSNARNGGLNQALDGGTVGPGQSFSQLGLDGIQVLGSLASSDRLVLFLLSISLSIGLGGVDSNDQSFDLSLRADPVNTIEDCLQSSLVLGVIDGLLQSGDSGDNVLVLSNLVQAVEVVLVDRGLGGSLGSSQKCNR